MRQVADSFTKLGIFRVSQYNGHSNLPLTDPSCHGNENFRILPQKSVVQGAR